MSLPVVSDRYTMLLAGLLAIAIQVGFQSGTTKTADELSRDLSDGRPKVRRRAAADLSEFGYEAVRAVPALSAALKDDDAAVRSAAALAISRIGPEAAAAVPNLISLLKDHDPITRQRAVTALHNIGPTALSAIESLAEALKDDALDNSPRAALALGRIGEPAIPALIEALNHPNPDTRGRAARGLGSLGPKARKAVPALVIALQDSDDWVRRYACWSLGSIGTEAKGAFPALAQRLKDGNLHSRFDAAEAMLMIDPSADAALSVLKSHDMLQQMPLYAASALALVPTEAEVVLPILIKALDDEPDWRVDMAINGIGRLGPKNGAPAAPKLKAIARNNRTANRMRAAETLAKLTGNPVELLAVIDQGLTNQSSERRVEGLKALAKLGPPAQQLAEQVIPLLKSDDWTIRESARSAIRQIDPVRANVLQIPN